MTVSSPVLSSRQACLGCSLLYASTDSAMDLVLNSVAAGFIFEMDEMLCIAIGTQTGRAKPWT